MQGATADVVLQPGTVIKAQVLQVLGNDEAQISIGGQTVEVATAGAAAGRSDAAALGVAGADGTIQLAVVNPQGGAAAAQAIAASVAGCDARRYRCGDAGARRARQYRCANDAGGRRLRRTSSPRRSSWRCRSAAQAAATQQISLAPLFANLGVAAGVAACRRRSSRRWRSCWCSAPASAPA